jgi:hypothetical protein
MKDRIGTSQFINAPVRNPTQNIFRRFVRMPGAGLPDMLADSRKKFEDFGKKALHTGLSEYLE